MGNIVQQSFDDCPAATRALFVEYVVLSLIFSVTWQAAPFFVLNLTCNVFTVVNQFKIWTLLTSCFFLPVRNGLGFLSIIIDLWMGMLYFPSQERMCGSTRFLAWVILVNVLINIIYILMMFLMSLAFGPLYEMIPIQGLFGLITVCLTRRSLENPNDSTSFWGLVQIPNVWYPVGFVAFFSLLSMRPLFDLIAALAVGYAYPYLYIESMLPSDSRVNAVENKFGCAGRSILGGSWVSASEAQMPDEERPRLPYGNLPDLGTGGTPSSEVQLARTGANFVAFSGDGHRLGSAA